MQQRRVETDRLGAVRGQQSQKINANILRQGGVVDYSSSYQNTYKGQQSEPYQKVSRYDLINKNFIFPQDKFTLQSSYLQDYKLNSENRLKTEKVTYHDNELFPQGKFEGNSNYNSSYLKSAQGERRAMIKHEGELKIGGKFEGYSKYETDFAAKQPQAREKITPVKNQLFPIGKFQGNSTYGNCYQGSQVERSLPMRHKGELAVGGKFEGTSKYALDYSRKQSPPRQEKIVPKTNEIMPKGIFQSLSTYSGAYINKGGFQPQSQIRPVGQLRVGEGHFSGQSSYEAQFAGKLAERSAPIIQPKNEVMPRGNFEGSSTYGNSYQGERTEMSKQFKPEGELKIGGKFEGNSNYSQSYNNNEGSRVRREQIRHADNKIMPQGYFESGSTYQNNFKGEKNEFPAHLIKHVGEIKVGGRFEGNSNYSLSYQNNEGSRARREQIRHADNKILPQGYFESGSTYKNTFKGDRNDLPAHLIKHDGEIKIGGKFEGNSNYALSYLNNEGSQVRRQKIKHPDNKFMPEGQFNDHSTYQNTFLGSKAEQPAHLIKHEGELKLGGKFQGNSNYSQNYIDRRNLGRQQGMEANDMSLRNQDTRRRPMEFEGVS